MQDSSETPSDSDVEPTALAAEAAPDVGGAPQDSPVSASSDDAGQGEETLVEGVAEPQEVVAEAAEAEPEPELEPESAPEESPAADLPSLEDLDGVAAEVQRVEDALPLLDKKNSPMCASCQSAFVDGTAEDRLQLLQCSHGAG